jgi:hypothetical protein
MRCFLSVSRGAVYAEYDESGEMRHYHGNRCKLML